jgi:quinoprotein glucose dehydrogenase
LALDATTGKRIWHYQTIHHDLFDYDNPPAPILITLHPPGGQAKDVVVQGNKSGYTFVLDRDTGVPVFSVTEMPAPRSSVPGEETYPTQPIPSKPKPLVRQITTEADLTNISPEAHAFALEQFRNLISGPVFTPASFQGTIMTPGWFGGEQWGGAAFDPITNVLFVNSNESPSIATIREVYEVNEGGAGRGRSNVTPAKLGRQIYDANCMACHGANREGNPPVIPGLLNELDRMKPAEIQEILHSGHNAMPAFNELRPPEVNAVIEFLKTPVDKDTAGTENRTGAPVRYASGGTRQFSDQDRHPAIAPPWGELTAINLVTGDFVWRAPLGEYPDLVAKGIRNTGTLNFGGPVVTAGDIVFIAATADEKFRAFESHSGRILWETQLPAGGYATPSVYMLDGKEYVVIAAGGGAKNGTKGGDSIVAFTLPDESNVPDNTGLNLKPSPDGWINLFDGKSLDGWVHLNGWNTFDVEDGAIVGRTMAGSVNSFLCTTSEWSDFELELETTVGPVTNQGIQFRTSTRPVTLQGGRGGWESQAGRIYGPQAEVRRFYPGQQTTGLLYGEGMLTGWFSSPEKWAVGNGHHFFVDEGWNKMRIVAQGPHIQTWVNGHPVEDLINDDLYKAHPKGFIGLQIHALTGREPGFKENGLDVNVPSVMKWRSFRIRSLPSR